MLRRFAPWLRRWAEMLVIGGESNSDAGDCAGDSGEAGEWLAGYF